MKHSSIVAVLAVALLLAQFGALAHAYSHLQSTKRMPDRTALHSALCADCSTFGTLLTPGGTASVGAALPVTQPAGVVADFSSRPDLDQTRHFFQAQAPPTTR